MNSTNSIIDRVRSFIIEERLIDAGEKVVVAFSGGPDSSCMLYILYALSQELGFSIHIAYLNHTLRKASEGEMVWAQVVAKRLGCDFTVGRYNVRWLSENKGLSLEDAARIARYRFLEDTRRRIDADKIAVAHNLNDQVETILLHLIRGCSVRGLSGMKAKQGKIIRPIICLTRSEVEEFCTKNNIEFKIDETNADQSYLRNRIRLKLIPMLKERYNPNIESALLGLSINAQREDAFISEYTNSTFERIFRKSEGLWSAEISEFLKAHEAIQYRMILLAVEKITGNIKKISRKQLEQAIQMLKEESGLKKTCIANGVYLYATQGRIFIGTEKRAVSSEYKFCPPYKLETEFGLFKAEKLPINKIEDVHTDDKNIALLDFDRLTLPMLIRARRHGDRFHPLGATGEKKLKKFFIDKKVPYPERDRIPLLINNDEIAWIAGVEISERYKVSKKTSSVLKITFMPDKGEK